MRKRAEWPIKIIRQENKVNEVSCSICKQRTTKHIKGAIKGEVVASHHTYHIRGLIDWVELDHFSDWPWQTIHVTSVYLVKCYHSEEICAVRCKYLEIPQNHHHYLEYQYWELADMVMLFIFQLTPSASSASQWAWAEKRITQPNELTSVMMARVRCNSTHLMAEGAGK